MNSARETAVGLFVLLGLLCVAYLTVKLGKMELFSSQGFELVARFDSVSGLRVGADVEMSGVPVGRVVDIRLESGPVAQPGRGAPASEQGPAAFGRQHGFRPYQRPYR